MKRFAKSVLGVTLLEIMLVLAVAAIIIVMSIRYYQSANYGQQANSLLEQIQAVTAAADGIAQPSGSYTNVSGTAIQPMMPNNSMGTMFGGSITVTGAAANYSVSISLVPQAVCGIVVSKLSSSTKFSPISPSTAAGCTGATNTITYTYVPQG